MRTVAATAASRGFSELLDAVERGDTITITRGGHPIAVVSPAKRYTVGRLVGQLAELESLDPKFESDIADALALLTSEVKDPWAED
ncbi:MAG: type II toxin-antitoxin system Phd/YefM family antitoxin [Propionibacteriaceae bacterium]|nr:type II toxin-antitoxin system Phd/YefM family antitoxin [Propionibacteriaceae bacterium]